MGVKSHEGIIVISHYFHKFNRMYQTSNSNMSLNSLWYQTTYYKPWNMNFKIVIRTLSSGPISRLPYQTAPKKLIKTRDGFGHPDFLFLFFLSEFIDRNVHGLRPLVACIKSLLFDQNTHTHIPIPTFYHPYSLAVQKNHTKFFWIRFLIWLMG